MKKTVSINISIPNPCNEDWDKMTPEGQGRFCSACQTKVTDFTSMTDEQVLNYFIEHKGQHICGRYLQSQLDRTMTKEIPSAPLLPLRLAKRIAAGFLFLHTLAGTAYAQTGKPKTEISPQQKKLTSSAHKILKGRVLDEQTRAGVAGIRVSVIGTDISATTNKYGRFQLALTDYIRGTIELAGSYTDSCKAKTNTVILNVAINADTLRATDEILLYRYPAEQQEDVPIVAYKVPLIDKYTVRSEEIEKMGGGIARPAIAVTAGVYEKRRYTLWHKITKPFRRKH